MDYAMKDLTPFVDTSPNLEVLSLPHAVSFLPEKFDLSRLSHLEFVVDSDNLSEYPNLISLGLIEDSCYDVGPILLAKLEILDLIHGFRGCSSYGLVYKSLFPLLRLPSLKALHLKKQKSVPDAYGPWPYVENFLVFIQQSSFQLSTFSIHRLFISDVNLVNILVHLPTLQHLTVDDSGISTEPSPISSEFVDSLHAYRTSSLRPQEACVVPRLRSLRLLNVAATTFRDISVVEMVQSRWSPDKLHAVGTSAFEVDCLRVFTMTFLDRVEAEAGGVYPLLGPIERGGMMIVIHISGITLRH